MNKRVVTIKVKKYKIIHIYLTCAGIIMVGGGGGGGMPGNIILGAIIPGLNGGIMDGGGGGGGIAALSNCCWTAPKVPAPITGRPTGDWMPASCPEISASNLKVFIYY